MDVERIVPAQVDKLPQSTTVGPDQVNLTGTREREQAVLDGRGWARGPFGDLERANREGDGSRGDGKGKRSDQRAADSTRFFR
jgi:hypothetical protein